MKIKNIDFDPYLATELGVNEAVIYSFFSKIINYSKISNSYFYENNYWIKMPINLIQSYLPFMSTKTITRGINKLVENNYLKKEKLSHYFMEKSEEVDPVYDQSYWYAVVNKKGDNDESLF